MNVYIYVYVPLLNNINFYYVVVFGAYLSTKNIEYFLFYTNHLERIIAFYFNFISFIAIESY